MTDFSLARRVASIPPTIFSEMSSLAVRTGALNLGQGFPDVDGPPSVIAAAVEALEHGANQYAPGAGIPALRAAIARHQQRHYGLELDPETEVVVTTGCTEAIAAALLGLVDPGDEVVVLEPYYDSYLAMIEMCGGVRRPVTLRAPDFRLDVDALRSAVGPRSRVLLLNTPHNPTGTVLTRAELQAVADVAIEHDLVVVTDEVYEHLVFDSALSAEGHVPLATLPGMRERTLTLSSAGKSYSFTGWKVGWATGPARLVDAVLAAKQWLSFSSGSPLQPAIAHGLGMPREFFTGFAAELQGKRDILVEALTGVGLPVMPCQGTYFVIADTAPLGVTDAVDFCRRMPQEVGVVGVPVSAFCDDTEPVRTLVRFAFCKREEVLREGAARLSRLHTP